MKLTKMIMVIFIIFVTLLITTRVMSEEHAEVEVVAVEKVEAEYNKDIWIRTLAYLYGVDSTIALNIASCESKLYGGAHNKNFYYVHTCLETGEVSAKIYQNSKVPEGFCGSEVSTKETHWSNDIGFWQINDYYHEKPALSMGLDIYDEKDNIQYGFWLFSIEGAVPWSASRHCHGMS